MKDAGELRQRALNVILRYYEGVSPERLYGEAVGCFDGLIGMSRETEEVRDFAESRGMDTKYLVDGANSVISKMHFNEENNFYVVLGLPPDASREEIRERWKRLMLMYHPDLRPGHDEEAMSERAKRVNEAYSILKDGAQKRQFDGSLMDPPRMRADVRDAPLYSGPAGNDAEPSGWDATKRSMPKILIGLYIVAAVIVLGFIFFQNRSSSLEAELSTAERNALPASGKGAAAGPSDKAGGLPPAGPSGAPQEKGIAKGPKIAGPGTRERHDLPSTDTVADAPPAVRDNALQARTAPPETDAGRRVTPLPRESSVSGRPAVADQQRTLQPGAAAGISAAEVEAFMKRYMQAYMNSDLDSFMSLFSRSATENGTADYQAMRIGYQETFSEKIRNYSLSDMVIRTEGPAAFVSGTYSLERHSASGRWVSHRGRISWRIVREDNTPKIVSIRHDH